ncbi:hypothetical protein PWT90_02388 [Aphanocladium album]|nr:hypothetical protein PWT90_02388 [Aphanocladium album]
MPKRALHIHAFAAKTWIPEFSLTTDPKSADDREKMTVKEHKGQKFVQVSTCDLCIERTAGVRFMRQKQRGGYDLWWIFVREFLKFFLAALSCLLSDNYYSGTAQQRARGGMRHALSSERGGGGGNDSRQLHDEWFSF